LAAALTGLAFINYQELFITRTVSVSRLEMKSISERALYLKDAKQLLERHWLMGAGIGNYTKALAISQPKRPWNYLNPVHNVFILVWVETGIGGALFFLALIIYLFGRSFRQKEILNLSILAILVIIMMFDHYFWSLHFGVLLFWATIGFIYKRLNTN